MYTYGVAVTEVPLLNKRRLKNTGSDRNLHASFGFCSWLPWLDIHVLLKLLVLINAILAHNIPVP